MTRAEQIYPLDKGIQRELERAEKDPFNRDVLIRYYRVRSGEMTKASILLYLHWLNEMSKLLRKPFEEAATADMENLMFELSKMKIADSTKNRIRKILKAFYRWLKKCPRGQFPPEVAWIATKRSAVVTVKAEDLLPFEECVKITECATNLRDKALFQCQLDAGCRIGEILTVKVGEVRFNDYGALLSSDGKTGEAPLILTWSAATLAQWLNIHPFRHDKDAPLFTKFGSQKPMQLSYHAAHHLFKKCVKRAGFGNRRVWFHLFKHVSCTWDYLRDMPQAYRNFKHHWTPNSDMNTVYEHLSNSVIPKIQQWGRPASEQLQNQKPENLKLTNECARCKFENPRDSVFCNRCGFALDDRKAAEKIVARARLDEFLDRLSQDPEKLKRIMEII